MAVTPVVIDLSPRLTAYVPPATSADLPQDLALDPRTGDFVLTPAGDVATVHGPARVLMDVWMLALSAVGSNLGDPEWGNPFIALVGGFAVDDAGAGLLAAGLVKSITGLQAARAAAGYPPAAGEQIVSASATPLVSGTSVALSITVVTQDSQQGSVVVPATGLTV